MEGSGEAWQARLEAALLRQQRRADALAARQRELCEENVALRECLEIAGVLREQTFFTQLHKRRFAQVLLRHPLRAGGGTLEDASRTHELAFGIGHYAGLDAVGAMWVASRSLNRSFASVMPELSTLFPSIVYVIGGSGSGSQGPLRTAEHFSPNNTKSVCSGSLAMTPQPTPSLLAPRACFAVVAWMGQIFAIAGHDSNGALSTVDRFDPKEDRWHRASSLLRTRGWLAAAATSDSICALGGDGEDAVALRFAESLESNATAWTPLPAMRSPRYAAAAAAANGAIYVTGGHLADDAVCGTAEYLPKLARSWQPLPPLQCARAAHAMVALRGKMYVVGGYDTEEISLASLESYDSKVGAWEVLQSMGTAKWGLAAVCCGGQIYVMGGKAGHNSANIAEVKRYDPEGQTWQYFGRLRTARRCFGSAVCR